MVFGESSAAREMGHPVEKHDERKISSVENETIPVVIAAERRRNTAWGFNPRKCPNRRVLSPVKGAGFVRLIPI